ncbi:hypothetical protein RJ55_07457 [Drechmeria coniospora]|nr:hypothetical protein RJ55_07457 [Drechmeria coniospora]
MGPPTPAKDKLWYDLAALRNFGVDKPTLQAMNRSKGAVEFPGLGGRFQVGMEAFHQLHCLNYVRMYTYQDHYGTVDYDMIAEGPKERQEHKDHCVEVLRQRLMCNPDLNVYSYHWTQKNNVPFGNLYTSHQCVDWDRFYAWAEKNAVSSPPLTKPEGAEVWS